MNDECIRGFFVYEHQQKRRTMPELKPCPFCGINAVLRHDVVSECRNKENGDLITKWWVWCPQCGTKQDGGISKYYFRTDETLVLVDPHFDGRKRAIEAWNRRYENG